MLQSPYDQDASYGHKGKGYSAHFTETCNNKGKSEIIALLEIQEIKSDFQPQGILQEMKQTGIKQNIRLAHVRVAI
jgi:hypothetical protein